MKRSKRGFTLVELLIVIVVIGVLSAMMMLSSTEAVSSAKAADIINNLRNWKTATLEWYTDNLDKVDGSGRIKKDSDTTSYTGYFAYNKDVKASEIAKYLSTEFTAQSNGSVKDPSGGEYYTDFDKEGKKWVIIYMMPTNDERLKAKLEARAATAGLEAKAKTNSNKGQYTVEKAQGGDFARSVAIEVMDFSK
ncbi:MAG: type II secretion system protein [Synergistaceae bacterium]|nr:type II secretion system protein [Synergistaceae bacterium]